MQPPRCFVLITVSVLVAFTCIDRHSLFVNYPSGQLPTISALLAIGCLKPPSSLASHASSASPQLLHRFTSVLVGVAILGQHAAEAKLEVVNTTTDKHSPYYGTPVSLKGQNDILITLDDRTRRANITWKFNKGWQILLEKWPGFPTTGIEISSNSCKWRFEWFDTSNLKLTSNDGKVKENIWNFPHDESPSPEESPPPQLTRLRITIRTGSSPTMFVFPVTNDSTLIPLPALPNSPEFCMLDTEDLVNVKLMQEKCRTNVTIENAKLLYDFHESTTTLSTPGNGTNNTTPLNGNATMPTTDMDSATESYVLYYAIGGGVGGLLLLAAIVGGVVAFFCIRGRRRRTETTPTPLQQEHYDDDADPKISKKVVEEEGLIEWDNVMAHAPYNPKPTWSVDREAWAFVKGDKVDLSTIDANEHAYRYLPRNERMKLKELEFLEDVKGNQDYGVCGGRFDQQYCFTPSGASVQAYDGVQLGAVIYYSKPPDRVKAFVDRLRRLAELYPKWVEAANENRLPGPTCVVPVRVPLLRYYWISSDRWKCSYFAVTYHDKSVAQYILTHTSDTHAVAFHKRVGLAFTTFAALASIHQLGCVHRDVTPAAFVLRGGAYTSTTASDFDYCYITHLSLSRIQYNFLNNNWRPRRRHVKYFGTHKYASRAAHAQQERSFKDDVESWFYTAVELIWPTKDDKLVMPWHLLNAEIGVTDRVELHKKYNAAKDEFLRTFSQNKLIVTFPAAQFRELAGNILKMTFETREADYKEPFIDLLYSTVEQLSTQADEASQQAVIDYIANLNEHQCYDYREFEYKYREKSHISAPSLPASVAAKSTGQVAKSTKGAA